MVSDESSLEDFPETTEVYADRVREAYGVDITILPNLLVPTTLEAIHKDRVS